ncbi:MAG TPA: hypothetical protein VN457_06480, partial [Chlamydiales bacterium]|nr:hypothetical protein [Chlamydiales bacterium]
MRIQDVPGIVFDVVKWTVVGSVGWIVFGIPKAIVEFKRRHDWSVKLAQVTDQIQKLQLEYSRAPKIEGHLPTKAVSDIGRDGRQHVEKTEGTQVLQKELLARLQLVKRQCQAEYDRHDREFQHGAIATIPIVGAFLANQFIQHSGIIAGLTYEIAKESSSINKVFFQGGEPSLNLLNVVIAGHLAPHTKLTGKDVKAFWEKAGAQQEFLPVHYIDETGAQKTRKIESMFLPGSSANGCKGTWDKTVVISHGAKGTLYGTFRLAQEYQRLGYNVLCYTLGGKQYGQIQPPKDG